MTETLNPGALLTLEQAKEELGIASNVLTFDNQLKRYINAISARVVSELAREFIFAPSVVEYPKSYGDNYLMLKRRPVVQVFEVVGVDGGVIDPGSYVVENAKAGRLYRRTGWTTSAVRSQGLTQDFLRGSEEPKTKVTYSGGWVTDAQASRGEGGGIRTLPSDLLDAAFRLLVVRWRGRKNDPNIKSESALGYSVSYRDEGLPPEVNATLDLYRNIVNG